MRKGKGPDGNGRASGRDGPRTTRVFLYISWGYDKPEEMAGDEWAIDGNQWVCDRGKNEGVASALANRRLTRQSTAGM